MPILSEPIGSIPRPQELIDGVVKFQAGRIGHAELDELYEQALSDTIRRFEKTGSTVITDGEQTKPSFVTYPLAGFDKLAAGGVTIPFEDGHTRQLPVLTGGPFRYGTYAADYLARARRHTDLPIKQAVIAPSALSLLYPADGVPGYVQKEFIDDLVAESAADIRRALDGGAASVQLDFTEGRLSLKLDPSKGLLRSFIDLNNRVLTQFSDAERQRIGVHTCPGGDQDSVHSLDVDYLELLPDLFRLAAGNFYLQLASESDQRRVLDIISRNVQADQRVFIGVTDPINPVVETPEQVRDRILVAAEYLPIDRMGTCDDCGFSPFGDDTSTSRNTAFAKIAARVEGTHLAAEALGV